MNATEQSETPRVKPGLRQSRREYPLLIAELREFEGGGSPTAFYTKGHHHDLLAFLHAVINYLLDPTDAYELDIGKVKQKWWRCIPVNVSGEWETLIVDAVPTSRGAFPVTVIEV